MKRFWDSISVHQKAWIICSTLAVMILGIIARDTWINIFIGTIGMFYVAVYGTGQTRWAFILGIVYVSVYTIICLQNRIMLDAIQNIVLIPLYFYSFFYWGRNKIKPRNITKQKTVLILTISVAMFCVLYGLSRILHGNYSNLDALNTTCTLCAMILGLYGISLNWAFWTVNNAASALTFGLALFTPTGSITVFAMKMIFFINGLIGWYNFVKIGNEKEVVKEIN